MRFKIIIMIALIFVTPSVFCQVGADENITSVFISTDSDYTEQAERIKRLISSGEEMRAIESITRALASKGVNEYCLQTDTKTIYLGLNTYYKNMLLSLPEPSIRNLRIAHDAQANQLLEKFHKTGSETFLRQIINDCYVSRYAPEAFLTLSEIFLEKGAPDKALLTIKQMKMTYPNFHDQGKAELISLFANYVCNNQREAESALAGLREMKTSAAVSFLGEKAAPSVQAEKLAKMYKDGALKMDLPADTHQRVDRLAEDVDLKLLKWKAPIPPAPSLAVVPRYYHPRFGRVGGGNTGTPYTIKGAPSFWRDNVIVNTGNSLMMFNIQTGKRVGGDLICGNPFDNNGLVNLSYSSMRNCVVDEDRVYSVFKRSVRMDIQGQAMPFIRGGEVVSFDLNTGKIIWVMNSANAMDKKATFFLDQCMFTSTPTLYNDVIYLEAVLPKSGMPEAHIVAISAETGKFLWERFICALSLNDNNPNARMRWRGDDFESYRLRYSGQGGMLCDGNRLYFCTELGVMGALNAISGEIYWLRKFNAHPGKFSWQASSPLMIGKSIVFAPTTCNDIYWLNPQDGSLEGFFKGEIVTEDINNASQILGISGEKLYLYYQNAVQEIGARSSKRLDQWGAYGPTNGGGVLSENRIYLPSKVNIMQIALKNKKIEFACGGDAPAEIGNLSIYRGCLFSISDNMLCVYQGEKPITPLPNVPRKPRPPFVPKAGLSADAVKVATLIYSLGDNDFSVRENAGDALVALKSISYDMLIDELNNPDPEISTRVRVILVKMGWKSPEELEAQFVQIYNVNMILHPNQRVRDQYENIAISQMGINAVQPLVKRTKVANQPDWRLRDSAVRLLGRLKPLPLDAVAALIDALKSDPENPVRITAKNSLTAATGQNFPSNQPQLWENWLKEQQAKQPKK